VTNTLRKTCGVMNSKGRPCELPAGHGTNRSGTGPCFLHVEDGAGLCGAKRRSGKPCRRPAGWSTDHPGIGRRKFHGGSTPSHVRSAIKTEAQRRMVTLGAPIETKPDDALLWVVYSTSGHVRWLQETIAELKNVSTREAEILTELYGQERDRLVRASKAAVDAGISERRIEDRKQMAGYLAAVMKGVLDDIVLTAEQKARAPEIVRRHLIAGVSQG